MQKDKSCATGIQAHPYTSFETADRTKEQAQQLLDALPWTRYSSVGNLAVVINTPTPPQEVPACDIGTRYSCMVIVEAWAPYPDLIVAYRVSQLSGAEDWVFGPAYSAGGDANAPKAAPQLRRVQDPASPSGWNTEWFNPADGGWHPVFVDSNHDYGGIPWQRVGLARLNG